MRHCIFFGFLLLAALPLSAQSPVDVGRGGMQTTALEEATGADLFATNFEESNVGFLHIYVDPTDDPLETYLLRGREMSDTAVAMLPARLRRLAKDDDATFYATLAIKGIDENLYLTRLDAPRRDQIDMFAIRDGKVKHLKTLAYLDCGGTECLQMDSYITDVNLDTDFDLIQIARRTTEQNGTTDERRTVYYMSPDNRRWKVTEELDVPWEGIQFYEPGHEEDH
ncbi:hypothetical protein GGR26_001537 [Lewinella marina]|uniref:Uncharacterized protein n=1 Tax=Neolewinella marina TaxID=438751 RepID=A0A2G0CF41_9BACT|nr:hypothetical protein [Neolewinella marina]NJB85792.1 hypothetical protein [Neolewinella marina]PHK98537.1 hypothetical protein CGL56_08660 [Neolewinella marina]